MCKFWLWPDDRLPRSAGWVTELHTLTPFTGRRNDTPNVRLLSEFRVRPVSSVSGRPLLAGDLGLSCLARAVRLFAWAGVFFACERLLSGLTDDLGNP